MRRVAVTGIGVVCPLADTAEGLHLALSKGESGLKPVELFDLPDGRQPLAGGIVDFDATRYLGKGNLRRLDRCGRLVSAAAQLALEHSGWHSDARAETEIGLVFGTMFGGVRTIGEFDRRALEVGPEYVKPLDFANTVISAAAGQAAIWLGLRGINTSIAVGMCSGLRAINYAADLIRSGRASKLLAGGGEELCYESHFVLDRAGLLCADDQHPRPFDAKRKGFAQGEGAAFLMLEEAETAAERGVEVLAEIGGGGSSFDGGRRRTEERTTAAVLRGIQQALNSAELEMGDIDAISTSASGSVREDACEAAALVRALAPDRRPALTAPKGALGEGLGASGAIQTAAMIEAMRTGALPGTVGFEMADSNMGDLAICAPTRSLQIQNALVCSAGFDGNHAALALRKPTL